MKRSTLLIVSPILLVLTLVAVAVGIFVSDIMPLCMIIAVVLVAADSILVAIFNRCPACGVKMGRKTLYQDRCPTCKTMLSTGKKP